MFSPERRSARLAASLSAALAIGSLLSGGACSLLFTPGDSGAESDAAGNGDAVDPCNDMGIPWRGKLGISFQGLDAMLDHVPVPIRFAAADFASYRLPDDPTSLRFVDDGGLLMPHEVEAWNSKLGGLVWVLMEQYPGLDETVGFDMYYGALPASSSEDPIALWTQAGYSAVFHFQANDFRDSVNPGLTPIVDTAVVGGGLGSGNTLGFALRFPGEPEAGILVPDDASQQSGFVDANCTIEARFQPAHTVAENRSIFAKQDAYSLASSALGDDRIAATLVVRESETDNKVSIVGAAPILNTWKLATLAVDAEGGRFSLSIDGVPTGTPPSFSSNTRKVSVEPLTIGQGFMGFIDELRISGESRPSGWQVLQTRLMNGPSLQELGPHLECPR